HLGRLIIELDAYGLSAYSADVQALHQCVSDAGARVALRGAARQPDMIARLGGHAWAHIKLSGGFVSELGVSPGAANLLGAVVDTASALAIPVLVHDVPAEVGAKLTQQQGVWVER